MNNKPIGVFDSGLGGLTAVRELKKLLPNEKIIYFGDTGRVPYGGRSNETIMKYTDEIIAFLKKCDVKMIIAACGTVSSICGERLLKELDIPFSGVVEHGAKAAVSTTKNSRIGIIGTSATVLSGAYGRAIKSVKSDIIITGKACPLFVPLVENGYIEKENPVTKLIVDEYLTVFKNENIDTLILGCTHYPLLKETINEFFENKVKLIDVGKETARYASKILMQKSLLCENKEKQDINDDIFYVTDTVHEFKRIASMFLKTEITSEVNLVSVEQLHI